MFYSKNQYSLNYKSMHKILFYFVVSSQLLQVIFGTASQKLFNNNGIDLRESKDLEHLWRPYKKSYDALLATSLRETFGRFPVHVYKNDLDNHLLMARGYYVSDNDRYLFLNNFRMSSLPVPKTMYVGLRPASMYLELEAALERIIMLTDYNVFRRNNKTSSYNINSPISPDKVPIQGFMSIVAENCVLSGTALVVINGPSFSLRHHNIGLKNCEFTVEVPGHNSAPIIAPYFSAKQRGRLERFMNIPIREELTKHLSGALISLFNLTEPLQAREDQFSKAQQKSIINTRKKFNKILQLYNKNLDKNTLLLKPQEMLLNFNVTREYEIDLKIKDVKLLGLDTQYSTNTGGPFEDEESAKIIEKVGFFPLVVMGNITTTSDRITTNQEFSVEIRDLTAEILMADSYATVDVNFWKIMEITMPAAEFVETSPLLRNILIGYLYKTLPEVIEDDIRKKINNAQRDSSIITKTTFDICKTTTIKTTPLRAEESEEANNEVEDNTIEKMDSKSGVVEAKYRNK